MLRPNVSNSGRSADFPVRSNVDHSSARELFEAVGYSEVAAYWKSPRSVSRTRFVVCRRGASAFALLDPVAVRNTAEAGTVPLLRAWPIIKACKLGPATGISAHESN